MATGVNLLNLFHADFGVKGRGVQLLVAAQLLDEQDVCAVVQHVRRARVPQHRQQPLRFSPAFSSHELTMRLTTSGLKSSP
jgi:hypothetical protein